MVGAVVSTVTARVPGTPALPAASVATALMLASAGTSALLKLVLQVPPVVAVAVLTAVPQVTATVAPSSAAPLM